jgi:hypothetical protein
VGHVFGFRPVVLRLLAKLWAILAIPPLAYYDLTGLTGNHDNTSTDVASIAITVVVLGAPKEQSDWTR